MSKKQDRAWFTCPRWSDLIVHYYADDETAARALRANPRVLARLRQQTPVARSTLLKLLSRLDGLHRIKPAANDLTVDTTSD